MQNLDYLDHYTFFSIVPLRFLVGVWIMDSIVERMEVTL